MILTTGPLFLIFLLGLSWHVVTDYKQVVGLLEEGIANRYFKSPENVCVPFCKLIFIFPGNPVFIRQEECLICSNIIAS